MADPVTPFVVTRGHISKERAFGGPLSAMKTVIPEGRGLSLVMSIYRKEKEWPQARKGRLAWLSLRIGSVQPREPGARAGAARVSLGPGLPSEVSHFERTPAPPQEKP